MLVACAKKGVVTVDFCMKCPAWENAKEGNPWGNSTATCQHFRQIIHNEENKTQSPAQYMEQQMAMAKNVQADRIYMRQVRGRRIGDDIDYGQL